ncbi:MAG: hypothetical protein M1839_002593 [Geoglossum umbratile]|nr:MAG: hypothetical protein M1839_002593 [Geoglossum umbratile]
MSKFLRMFRGRHQVRASTASTIAASASVPGSGFVFIDNSQGASAAIAELSRLLDDAIEIIEFDDDPCDEARFQLRQLDAEAFKYINSRLDESRCRPWTCPRADSAIVDIAVQCALAVYDQQVIPVVDGFNLTQLHYKASTGSSIDKATLFTLARPAPGSGHFSSLLIVSVRGTAGPIDHLVNLNGTPQDAQDFIDLSGLQQNSGTHTFDTIEAHGGFLDSAKALIPDVVEQIQEATARASIGHVLFTGHSAGGAVASLVFAHLLSTAAQTYPSLKFSNITFGSPPVTRQNLSPLTRGNHPSETNRGLVLDFVNEYDLVARADPNYIRSLVDLYRTIYRLPKIQDHATAEEDRRVLLGLSGGEWRSMYDRRASLPVWPLPAPDYFHLGQVIVLKAGVTDLEGEIGGAGQEARLDLRAYVVRPDEFARLLFCRISVHTRLIYLENVKEIAEGRLHGRTGW